MITDFMSHSPLTLGLTFIGGFLIPWVAGCIVLIYSAVRIIKVLIWGELADK